MVQVLCWTLFLAVMWVFYEYVAAPLGKWYAASTNEWGLLILPAVALFAWWSLRREKRLIAEGKIDPPRRRGQRVPED